MVLLTISAMSLFVVTGFIDAASAVECKYRYYYVSMKFTEEDKKSNTYTSAAVRVMEMRVFNAYIYDLNLPTSWAFDISNHHDPKDIVAFMAATAKSDNDTIKYKDLKYFVILRQPNNKPEEEISIKLTILNMTGKKGIGVDISNSDYDAFTVETINKCLPEKPRRR